MARRPAQPGRICALLLAVLVVLPVLAGVPAVAQESTDEIERDGTELHVTLDPDHFENDTSIQIEIRDDDGVLFNHTVDEPRDPDADPYVYRVPLADLNESAGPEFTRTNLADVGVHVLIDEEDEQSIISKNLDLRYLTFGPKKQAEIDGKSLRLPVRAAFGFNNGAGITIRERPEGEPIDSAPTLRYEDNRTWVVFDDTVLEDWLANPRAMNFTATAGDHRLSTKPLRGLDLRSIATTSLTATDDGLRVENPLLLDGEEFDVELESDGTLYASRERATDGAIALDEPSLLAAESFAVSLYYDGERVNPEGEELSHSGGKTDATIENGTILRFDDATFDAGDVTTLWIEGTKDGEPRFVPLSNLSVTDGMIDLSATVSSLDGEAYRFVAVTDEQSYAGTARNEAGEGGNTLAFVGDGDPARQAGTPAGEDTDDAGAGGTAAESVNGSSDGAEGGLLSSVTSFLQDDPLRTGLIVLAFVLAIALAYLLYRIASDDSSTSTKSTQNKPRVRSRVDEVAGTTPSGPTPVEVSVREELTGDPVSCTVRADRVDGPGRVTERADGGQCTMDLERGHWNVEASLRGVRGVEISVPFEDSVDLAVPASRLDVQVADAENGSPIREASVACEPDEGNVVTGRTGRDGSTTVEVPGHASEATLSVEHDRYESTDREVSLGGRRPRETVELRPRTGAVRAIVSVDGVPVGDAPVVVEPIDGQVGVDRRERTGRDGTVRFDGLPVGDYEVAVVVAGDAFRETASRVSVRDDETAEARVSATFEYDLGPDQRDRLREMRADAESLSNPRSSVDGAIRHYYGTVLFALVDAIEALPDRGHLFATAGEDPDAVVEALLPVAREAISLLQNGLATRQNVDLYAACADLPEDRVTWPGSFAVEDLFDWLADDQVTQRRRLTERLEAVDERIRDEQPDFAVVSPARDPWSGVRDLVRAERGDDPVHGAALGFVVDGLLAAIEDLFDQPALRERLKKTVF